MLKLGSTPDKREQYRLMRDAMEKRFIRVTRGSIVGGVRLGMFTAAFYGLQNLLAEKRGVHDVFNVVGAGSATAAAFGLICKKMNFIHHHIAYYLWSISNNQNLILLILLKESNKPSFCLRMLLFCIAYSSNREL
uniref:Complex I assembly factor TIMMDC1, mitochondrial n=1 Tax=Nelumbo nucifera TaxID=4432 RepID=A0A822YTV3_NELNU|nr:TPA_asm: hypothetical protein HUJ06_005185 [Nelumbo nucifera]